jgi:hypothetical protein
MEVDLIQMILAAGALGTAAFGIVDGLKATAVGAAGFPTLAAMLGPLKTTLAKAYGNEYLELLKAQYRDRRGTGPLSRTLRQGVRIGLTKDNAAQIAMFVGEGIVDGSALANIAEKIAAGAKLTDTERGLLGRFELAVDTRIDAAVALAEEKYKLTTQWWASGTAVALALIAAWALGTQKPDLLVWEKVLFIKGMIVGLVAVPLAPIAKDVASALQSATKALKARK